MAKHVGRVHGIDVNAAMLDKARAKCLSFPSVTDICIILTVNTGLSLGNVSFTLADMCQLPFANDMFDGVYAMQTLHHLTSFEQLECSVIEACRVCYLYRQKSMT